MTITDYSFVRDAFNHRSPYQKSDKYCLADIRKRNELILSTVKRLHHSLLPTTSSPPSCANRFLQSLVAAIRSVTHDLRSRIGARPSCSRPKPKPMVCKARASGLREAKVKAKAKATFSVFEVSSSLEDEDSFHPCFKPSQLQQ